MTPAPITTRPQPHRIYRNLADPGIYCLHCGNIGLVVLDQPNTTNGRTQQPTGAPCPVCEKGAARDLGDYNGNYWRTHRNLQDVTWNNGLTWQHTHRCRLHIDGEPYPCSTPATNHYCDYHQHPKNRKKTNYTALMARLNAIIGRTTTGLDFTPATHQGEL